MNILLIEDNRIHRRLIPLALKKACSDETKKPDITIISTIEELQSEIQNVLDQIYDVVLVDTELGKNNAKNFVQKLINNDTNTPLLSISSTSELSEKYSIPHIGKDRYKQDTSIFKDIYNGRWKQKREETQDKRTKALAKILSQEK